MNMYGPPDLEGVCCNLFQGYRLLISMKKLKMTTKSPVTTDRNQVQTPAVPQRQPLGSGIQANFHNFIKRKQEDV
jgi:hypothetical protein